MVKGIIPSNVPISEYPTFVSSPFGTGHPKHDICRPDPRFSWAIVISPILLWLLLLLRRLRLLLLLGLVTVACCVSFATAATEDRRKDAPEDQKHDYSQASREDRMSLPPVLLWCGGLLLRLWSAPSDLLLLNGRRYGYIGLGCWHMSRFLYGGSAVRTEAAIFRQLLTAVPAIPISHDHPPQS
jgi:hypothetical protein